MRGFTCLRARSLRLFFTTTFCISPPNVIRHGIRGVLEVSQLKSASFRWYKRSSRRFCGANCRGISLSVTKCCKFTTREYLNSDPTTGGKSAFTDKKRPRSLKSGLSALRSGGRNFELVFFQYLKKKKREKPSSM